MPQDSHNSENISRFFDTSDIHADPFGKNRSYDRGYRRAERITAAVFLATKHLTATDPLSMATREAATDMLGLLVFSRGEGNDVSSPGSISFRAKVRYLISLLRMLTVAGAVSMKNSSVLVSALDELCAFLGSTQNASLSSSVSFSREDFLDTDRGILMDIKDRVSIKDKSRNRIVPKMSNTSPTAKRESSVRSQNILGVLRSGGDFGIADIASNLPEYSKKMVQRELADLIAQGKVKKEGLKRWSRYSIVS